MDRVQCQWCRALNNADTLTCLLCGAPLSARNLVSRSGWRAAPRLRKMTQFRFSNSTCQVEGALVPVAEVILGPGDGVYFEHEVLTWKDPDTPIGALPPSGPKRTVAGRPHLITTAQGPGRVAFSRDAAGELVVLPLPPGIELDAREHGFLMASHTVQYSFVRIKGLVNVLHGGSGMYVDRFVTTGAPGLLLLHGHGNVLERVLGPGEKLLVEPGGFLYKDSSVQMNVHQLNLKTGLFRKGVYLAEMVGPGRVGIQSMYRHHRTA